MLAIVEVHNRAGQDVPILPRSMIDDHFIIELFGPPASGKSTLAKALLDALQDRGIAVQLNTSARPAEHASSKAGDGKAHWSSSVAAPLSRAAKAVNLAHLLVCGKMQTEIGKTLLRLLPPGNLITKARLQRYLWLLYKAQTIGMSFRGITIIDQGYVTALCSLAVRTKFVDPARLARSLDSIPRPDLLICLNTPHEILQARRAKRLARQNKLERLFEQGLTANRRQVEMVDRVAKMARENHWEMLDVSWVDSAGLEASVDKIVHKVGALQKVRFS
jgi:thymidylate kinase